MRTLWTATYRAAILLAALTAQQATAQPSVDEIATAHTATKGYKPVDTGKLEAALATALGGTGGMIPRDSGLSAIEKALLLVDLEEKPLPRLRYVLRYGQQTVDKIIVSFIDVERFNLGPAVRKDTIEAYGAENVADAPTFGVGPDVAWRFVTQPTAKSPALLLAASRMEIPEKAASKRDCLPRLCLSLDPLDDFARWQDDPAKVSSPQTIYPFILKNGSGDDATREVAPAAQALQLALAAGLAKSNADGVTWDFPERASPPSDSPYVVILIDRNLGQEVMSDAALGIAKLDKDRNERWIRLSSGVFDDKTVQSLATAKGPLKKHD